MNEIKIGKTKKTKKTQGKRAIKPIIIDEISSEKVVIPAYFEKKQVRGGVPVPEGHIRVIVLKDYNGMSGEYLTGDIIDLPERRFKTLCLRGIVEEYKGEGTPNRKR